VIKAMFGIVALVATVILGVIGLNHLAPGYGDIFGQIIAVIGGLAVMGLSARD
jgi:hypothetical protein